MDRPTGFDCPPSRSCGIAASGAALSAFRSMLAFLASVLAAVVDGPGPSADSGSRYC